MMINSNPVTNSGSDMPYHADSADNAVTNAVGSHPGHSSDKHRRGHRYRKGEHGKVYGRQKTVPYDFRDWAFLNQRFAEVALDDTPDPVSVPDGSGAVEAQLFPHMLEILFRCIPPHHYLGRITRQHLRDSEYDYRDHEKGDYDQAQAHRYET